MLNLFRNLGGSVGVSFAQALLQERTQFHQARLAEHITAYNVGKCRLRRSMARFRRRHRS